MKRHALAIAALCLPVSALAQDGGSQGMDGFAAEMAGPDGTRMGEVRVMPTASGTMLVSIAMQGLPPGLHAIHIHTTGDCGADDFGSAGGHLAGDRSHGVFSEDGPHPGDLPNTRVANDGTARAEYFDALLTAEMIGDQDGAAVIVHEGEDDYESQPSGDAGGRIACGVLEQLGG